MIQTGDVTFILICTFVVMLMVLAVGILYAGLAEKRYGLTMIMQVCICIPIITVVWALLGFSLAYGGDTLGGFVGGLDYALLRNIGLEAGAAAPGIPFALFFVFQATFAIITPALLCGALIGRMRLLPYLIFICFWSLLVYSPAIHWVWGGGILQQWGYIDYAGGVPIHMLAGFAALGAVKAIGNREKPKDGPSSVMHVLIAMAILWAGWFCFNGGSAMAANGTAVTAMVSTLLGSSAGAVTWMLLAYVLNGKNLTVVDLFFGALAGLVVSSPLAGYVEPWAMLFAGALAGIVCYGAMSFRIKRDYDDTLDVWALHGGGGLLGALLLGVFAHPALAPAEGLLFGNAWQVAIQACGILFVAVYAYVITYVMVKIINAFCPFRSAEDAPQDFGAEEDAAVNG